MAKGPNAFRTISEAADELGVPQHVLRFWETKFSFIRPMKRAGGRRFYRPQDIAVLNGVRALLHDEGYTIKGVQLLHTLDGVALVVQQGAHDEGYTIKGVQKLHKDLGVKRLLEAGQGGGVSPMEGAAIESVDLSVESRDRLSFALDDLNAVKARLDALLKH